MPARLLDPAFRWIPAATHDADSTLFRERQRARIAAAEKARKADAEEARVKVKQIGRRRSA